MTLDLRLQALMRRRGIKSQSQLARLAGVSQSSIHRILLATPGYTPTRAILMRLAYALDTSISWLSEGAADLHWPERRHADGQTNRHAHGHAGARASSSACDDDASGADERFDPLHEWRQLFTQLPRAEREALLALARLMQQRHHGVVSTTQPNRCAIAPSLASSAPAGYPLALVPYEACPTE